MGDHRNYDPMTAYLDSERFRYALADLRGYGLSRELSGEYSLQEAVADVLALAASLAWTRFHLVGHSMSSLVAQQTAAIAPGQVATLVLLTPIVPSGMGLPAEVIDFLGQVGGDEAKRREALTQQWGDRLSSQWLDFKLQRWTESARPEAAHGYVRMFAAGAVTGRSRANLPVLAIIGEHDNQPFQETTVRAGMSAAYSNFELAVCANAGHYPMQETPVALATIIDRFLSRNPMTSPTQRPPR
jgi:pimeloyl-ACP methyl ester carboxylesterase